MANSFEPMLRPAENAPQWLAAMVGQSGFAPASRFGGGGAESGPPAADERLAAAYAEGEAAGRAAALADFAQDNAVQGALGLELTALDNQLRDRLAERLAETVAALCEATLAPLALDRVALQQRCVNAACAVGEGIIDAGLRLNPEDIDLLDPAFAATWHIISDPELERGTVVFDMPEGAVRDGPEEWRIALREALGLC